MNNPLISIIIPIYNSEKYLKECLDSVINQTYNNLEIIIVDDGSTDNSLEIIKNYKDERIKLINKENGGVSSARNAGLKQVTGEYIMFVDSDDYLTNNNVIENIVKNIKDNIDFYVISNYESNNNKLININNQINKNELILSTLHWINSNVYKDISFISGVVCKLFNSRIIKNNNLLFKESITMGEDLIFNLEYISNSSSVFIINEHCYEEGRNNDSITRKLNHNIVLDDIKYQNILMDILKKLDINNLDLYKIRAGLGGILTCCDSYFFKLDINMYFKCLKEFKELLNNDPYNYGLKNLNKVKEYFNNKQYLLLFLIKYKLYFLGYLIKKISKII